MTLKTRDVDRPDRPSGLRSSRLLCVTTAALAVTLLAFGVYAVRWWFAPAVVGGTVRVLGEIPEPRPIPVRRSGQDQVIFQEDLVVSDSRGLANVVVSIAPAPSQSPPLAPGAVRLRYDDNRFVPRVLTLRAGQSLRIENRDRCLHNFHTRARSSPNINRVFPRGTGYTHTFEQSEKWPVSIHCDIHPWEIVWVAVFDHAFHAVTDARGEFELPPVPAGEYTITFWHEKLGTMTRRLLVRGGQRWNLTIDYGQSDSLRRSKR